MNYIDDLINEYKLTKIKYLNAKNNHIAVVQKMAPDYIKEEPTLLRQQKRAYGFVLHILEDRLKIYGIEPEKIK